MLPKEKKQKKDKKDDFENNINQINLNTNTSRSKIFTKIFNRDQKNTLEYFTNLLKREREKRSSQHKRSKSGIGNLNYYPSHNRTNIWKKIYSAINKTLCKKFNALNSDFESFIIDNLIYNRNCHMVSIFKDYMILDYIDEFFKRMYKGTESRERIPKFANYYKNYLKFFCNPIFRDFKVNNIIQAYGDNRAELYYNKNYGNKKKTDQKKNINHIDENLRTIFNTTVKDNINHNSMTQTIRNESNNNSFDGSNTNYNPYKPVIHNRIASNGGKTNHNDNSTHLNAQESVINKSGLLTHHSKEESLIIGILSNLGSENINNYYTNKIVSSPKIKLNSLLNSNNNLNINLKSVDKAHKTTKKINEDKIKEIDSRILNINQLGGAIKPNVLAKLNNYIENKEKTISKEKVKETAKDNKDLYNYDSPNPTKLKSVTQRLNQEQEKAILNTENVNKKLEKIVTNSHIDNSKTHTKTLSKINEYKNLKLTRPTNFNSNPINTFNQGSSVISSIISNHNKNIYSTEFNNNPTPGQISTIQVPNTQVQPMTLTMSKIYNSEKEKTTTINTSNSNTNTPNIHGNKTSNKSHFQSINDLNKIKKININTQTVTALNTQNNNPNLNSSLKASFKSNNLNDINTNNYTSNNFYSSSNVNNKQTGHNEQMHKNIPHNDIATSPINNNNLNSLNDIMKITLSLYMDKSSRNTRQGSGISHASTQHILNSPLNLLDTGRKTIINKVDSIHNFNININNQININNNTATSNKNGSSNTNLNQLNNKIVATEELITKNVNTNLQNLIEKNKVLSRNKNPSLYKTSSNNQVVSAEEDNNKYRNSIEGKIFNSYSNIDKNKQLFYKTNKLNDNLLNNKNSDIMMKHTLDHLNNRSPIKNNANKNDLLSSSRNKNNNNFNNTNKKFIVNPNIKQTEINKKAHIQKFKLQSQGDVKKLLTGNVSNIRDSIGTSIKNTNEKNNKVFNIYQTAGNIKKNYISTIKKII